MRFEKTSNDATLPTRATARSAGYDFYSPSDFVVPAHGTAIASLEVKVSGMKEDEVLLIFVRSGMAFKSDISLANSVGVIDADYDLPIGIKLVNGSDRDYAVKKGDRVCQGILSKFLVAEDDCPRSGERTGGFGSTGR